MQELNMVEVDEVGGGVAALGWAIFIELAKELMKATIASPGKPDGGVLDPASRPGRE